MSQTTLSKTFQIQNSRGLHARAAAAFVKVADTFKASVFVSVNDQKVSGNSIMGLMTLGASRGTEIKIICSGKQAKDALDALGKLINDKFNED